MTACGKTLVNLKTEVDIVCVERKQGGRDGRLTLMWGGKPGPKLYL